MKVELLDCKVRLFESIKLRSVYSLDDLKDDNGKFYNEVVNVSDNVILYQANLNQKEKIKTLPIKFGKVDGSFFCVESDLTSLIGAPREVGGNFECSYNKLTSLEGVHKIVKKINGVFNCRYNFIKSGGIGLLLIEGITEIRSELPVFDIIEKYLGQGKAGLLRCQEELIEAGHEEFAKL